MGISFRDFAEFFFQLSDCVLFSTFVELLPVRVFPFYWKGSGSVLSSTALSSENTCRQFLCR